MDILKYTSILISALVVNYVIVSLIALWALLVGRLLPIDFLEMLLLTSQFILIFKAFFNFTSSIKEKNLANIKKKFNSYYVIGGFGISIFAITWFDAGIFMDVFNRGLYERVYLQIYYLGYNVILGNLLSGLITELIAYMARVVEVATRAEMSGELPPSLPPLSDT